MARALDVYLHNDLVGQLAQDDGGDLSFQYDETWMAIRKRCETSAARFRS
jgi:HipA-like protein